MCENPQCISVKNVRRLSFYLNYSHILSLVTPCNTTESVPLISLLTPWSTHPSDGLVNSPLHVSQLNPRGELTHTEG